MPQYKDETTGTWYCKFYYEDYTGTKKQKKKRGFPTKREAAAWERNFLEKQQADLTITFANFCDIYLEDMSHRLRTTTMTGKYHLINCHFKPFFGHMPLCEIKPSDIRKWQNYMISGESKRENTFSETTLKTYHNQLTSIFNYAVRYYGLKENPCTKAGSIGKKQADDMEFWTKEEFTTFIHAVDDIKFHALFNTLYYTGMRVGELLALTPSDIHFADKTITINKSYQRLKQKDIISPPKTPKGNRTITIPNFLCIELNELLSKIYCIQSTDRIFEYKRRFVNDNLKRYCKKANVKIIRVHDLRHSHASLLIELGFSPLLIAERLGHEKIETTLNTYSHLYPHKQYEISNKLDSLK